jgi:hypothetical protein
MAVMGSRHGAQPESPEAHCADTLHTSRIGSPTMTRHSVRGEAVAWHYGNQRIPKASRTGAASMAVLADGAKYPLHTERRENKK